MTDTLTLDAQKREKTGRHDASALRQARRIPGVLYGNGHETQHVSVDAGLFNKVFKEAGESSLVNFVINDGEPVQVLIQDVQRDPLTHEASHVDFHQVRMDEKIKAEVALEFIGESAAVKQFSGILLKNMDHVEVTCLPGDLPHEITVDISSLATFEDQIRVSDLPKIPNVEFLSTPDDIVAAVSEPRSTAEIDALDEAVVVDVDSVEVEGAKASAEGEAGDGKAAEGGDKKE